MKFIGAVEKTGTLPVKIVAGTGLVICTVMRILFHEIGISELIYDSCLINGVILFSTIFVSTEKKFWKESILIISSLVCLDLLECTIWKSRNLNSIILLLVVTIYCIASTCFYFNLFRSKNLIRKSFNRMEVATYLTRLLWVIYYFLTISLTITILYMDGTKAFFHWIILVFQMIFFIFLLLRDFNLFNRKDEVENDQIVVLKNELKSKEIDPAMKVLYERFCIYMMEKQPYLSESCQVEEVARELFTNKTYLSRMVNLCTGLNFPKLINQYRVQYSMELYKKDMHLKVSELSEMSGFHSNVTYNMAFKYFMNLSPSEWCREYRESVD